MSGWGQKEVKIIIYNASIIFSMVMQERGIVVNPGEVRLKDRGSIEYPKTDFQYNRTSAEVTVEDGKGVLIFQKTGRGENNKINVGVVEDFQSHTIGDGSKGPLKIPAGYWSFFYNIGNKPLKVTINHNLSEAPIDELEVIMPNSAFRLVRQNNAPALLPTLRVSEIKRVNRGGIPEGIPDWERTREISSGWHGKV